VEKRFILRFAQRLIIYEIQSLLCLYDELIKMKKKDDFRAYFESLGLKNFFFFKFFYRKLIIGIIINKKD